MRKITKSQHAEMTKNRRAAIEISKNGCAGCYAFFNSAGQCLYVGFSRNVAERVGCHFNSTSNTKRYSAEFDYVVIYDEIDIGRAFKIYKFSDVERWLISWMRPKYNKSLTLGG